MLRAFTPPGGGGGTVTGSGTPDKLAKFTGTGTSIGDSLLSESGTTITSAATAETFTNNQTWTLPSDPAALTVGGVLTLSTSQKRLGINAAPGTLLHVTDGIVAAPSYDGIRLGNTGEALFSSTDSIRGFRAGVDALSTVVVGSTTSHDVLLQRGLVTAITLGASGAVAFAGNLTSSAAQTWTLASGTSALNVASGLLNLDTTNSRVGIGTTSPVAPLHVFGTSTTAAGTTTASAGILRVEGSVTNKLFVGSFSDVPYGMYLQMNSASYPLVLQPAGGNVGIGTASPGAKLHIVTPDGSPYPFALAGTTKGLRIQTTASLVQIDGVDSTLVGSYQPLVLNGSTVSLATGGTARVTMDATGNFILGTASGVSIQAAGTNQGIKLATTPGNTDPNTLDSYREGTRVLAAGDLSGWTYVTATQYWTLVGRTVTLHTIFTGGTSSATGGATIATPPLLTPLRIAAGAAVNSGGTALGNGACVVASTSSTTGTVTTSSAVSSSSVDKVITVTYETAGL